MGRAISTAKRIASASAMAAVASARYSHFCRPCVAISCSRSMALSVS
jgi:hypothetical protein